MSPEFEETARRWYDESGELLVMVRYHAAAGSRDYRLFDEIAALQSWIAILPPRTSVTVFRGRHLPLRGVIDEPFIARCLREIPDDAWHLISLTEPRTLGKVTFFFHTVDRGHAALEAELRSELGEHAVVGLEPDWFDSETTVEDVVPYANGHVARGIY